MPPKEPITARPTYPDRMPTLDELDRQLDPDRVHRVEEPGSLFDRRVGRPWLGERPRRRR